MFSLGQTARRTPALALPALLLVLATAFLAPSARAGLLQIDFTASDGAGNDAVGQFVLDTSAPWTVNGGFASGVIVSAWFDAGDVSGVADLTSSFTSVFAGDTPTVSAIELIADYGVQLFGLALVNDDEWFPTDNPFDVLTPGLSLDDLDPFGPFQPVDTGFYYFETQPFTTNYLELTSLSLTAIGIAEPGSLLLCLVGGFLLFGRRLRG